MKLWHLTPKENLVKDPWTPWYDKAMGFVIRAETEEQARKLATKQGGDEVDRFGGYNKEARKDAWLNSQYSDCAELLTDGEEEVIIRDFAAA